MAQQSHRRLSPVNLLVTAVLFSLVQVTSSAKNCFSPKGDQILNAVPCHPNAEVSACCELGNICLSNGLCSPGPDVPNNGFVDTYRPAGCTDSSWNSTDCFSGCNSFEGNGLAACGSGSYCCYDMNGCDCSSTSLFKLGAATFETTLPLSTMAPTSTPASTPATTTAATTPTAAVSSRAGSAVAPSQTAGSGSSSESVKIGAGIGVGLGVPLIAVTGFLIYFLMKRRRNPPGYSNYPPTKPQEMGLNEPRYEAPGYYSGTPYHSERYAHEVSGQAPAEMEAPAEKKP